jgi:hypothetical protein
MGITDRFNKVSEHFQRQEASDSRTISTSTFRWLSFRNPRNLILIAEVAVFVVLVAEVYLTFVGLKGSPSGTFVINRW